MQDDMGIANKFRGGYGWQTITSGGLRDNRDIRYGDTGIWRWRKQRRCGTGDRRDAGTTYIVIFG